MVSAEGGTPYTSMGLEVQGVDRKATKVLVTAQQPREMVTAWCERLCAKGLFLFLFLDTSWDLGLE